MDNVQFKELESLYIAEDGAVREQLHRQEIKEDLAEAMLSLDSVDRDILVLHYFNGYHRREIAEILGITVSAVYKREQRARDRLKEILRRQEL